VPLPGGDGGGGFHAEAIVYTGRWVSAHGHAYCVARWALATGRSRDRFRSPSRIFRRTSGPAIPSEWKTSPESRITRGSGASLKDLSTIARGWHGTCLPRVDEPHTRLNSEGVGYWGLLLRVMSQQDVSTWPWMMGEEHQGPTSRTVCSMPALADHRVLVSNATTPCEGTTSSPS